MKIIKHYFFCDIHFQFPKGREVEDGDSFVFNVDFSAPLYRIKVDFSELFYEI